MFKKSINIHSVITSVEKSQDHLGNFRIKLIVDNKSEDLVYNAVYETYKKVISQVLNYDDYISDRIKPCLSFEDNNIILYAYCNKLNKLIKNNNLYSNNYFKARLRFEDINYGTPTMRIKLLSVAPAHQPQKDGEYYV